MTHQPTAMTSTDNHTQMEEVATNGVGAASKPSLSPSTRRNCLLVIDVQNDFCTGSLKAEGALHIIPVINRMRLGYEWDMIVYTGDAHPLNHVSFHANHLADPNAKLYEPLKLPNGQVQVMWPVHCVQGTWGQQLHADLIRDPTTDVVVDKGTVADQEYYSAFLCVDGVHRTNLSDILRQAGITHVATCGLVYEYCVGNSAIDSAREGFNTYFVTDGVKGLREEEVRKMKEKMENVGITIINSQDLPQHGFKPRAASTTSTPSNSSSNAASASSSSSSSSSSPSNTISPSPTTSASPSSSRRPHLLLGLSGSVAAIKAVELVSLLSVWAEVRVIATRKARHFFEAAQVEQMGVKVYCDEDEWKKEDVWKKGESVLHIELRRWADMLLIAPLSANTLAKIANGFCDNLLTCVVRCWNFASSPLLLAPAMNTLMWSNPFTSRHLDSVTSLGGEIEIIQPISKTLACGDTGMGAMEEVKRIDDITREAWKRKTTQTS